MKQKPAGPRDFQGLWESAIRHHQAGQLGHAIDAYRKALAFRPHHAETHNYLGHALRSTGRRDEAAKHYERAIALKVNFGNAHYNLALTLQELGRTQEAEEQFRIAYSLEPDSANIHNNLGRDLGNEGRFDEARAQYDHAIRLNPGHINAHLNRALITEFHCGDSELQSLARLAARSDLSAADAASMYFALAKGSEDMGRDEEAFRHYRKANGLKRTTVPYDEARTLTTLRQIARIFSRELLTRFEDAGDLSTRPIFIVGMPRSGSTLLEQILSSHPQIHGAGELATLEGLANSLFASPMTRDSLAKAARHYLDELPAGAQGTRRTIDKMPANFRYLGLIHLAFPNAQIIHTMRDPLDTCASCYTTPFAVANEFTWDLGELGRYYRSYAELMAHWRAVLPPGRMLEVVYEDVVDNLERQARRMIEYCGLDWDEHCLRFHENRRTVNTASFVQVRKPLFRTSVGRWRRFESELGTLIHELKDIALPATRTHGAAGS